MPPLADHSVDCLSVFAHAETATLPRVFEVLCLFDVVPQRCHVSRSEAGDSMLVIDLQMTGLPVATVDRLRKRLERIITITQVLWSKKCRLAA